MKGDVLTYFTDPSNQYFPSGSVDLRYAKSAELCPGKDKNKEGTSFSVTTDSRTYDFRADSATSAKEWVKQLQKIIFRSRNEGDSVKISLPIDNIIDIEETSLLDLAETIKIRVIDNDETFAVDEYFFSFFGHGKDAQDVLRVMIKDTSAQRAFSGSPLLDAKDHRRPSGSRDKRSSISRMSGTLQENVRVTLSPGPAAARQTMETSGHVNRSSLGTARGSFDRGRRSSSPDRQPGDPSKSPAPQDSSDSFATSLELAAQSDTVESLEGTDASGSQLLSESVMFHEPTIRKDQNGAAGTGRPTVQPHRYSQGKSGPPSHEQIPDQSRLERDSQLRATATQAPTSISKRSSNEGLELDNSDSSALGGIMRAGTIPIQRASGIAGYISKHGKKVTNLLGTSPYEYYGKFSGMMAGGQKHYFEADALSAEDHVNDVEDDTDVLEAGRSFRKHFALPESEKLVAAFFGCLHRVLPLYGKIYIGTTKLCFRSMLISTKTKVSTFLWNQVTIADLFPRLWYLSRTF